jgi:flagellin
MVMSINTNLNSLEAQRNAAKTQLSLSTSIQRLSSGLRVNSAQDDAAGLAIATRMDAQSRGMNVAIRNANDGISLLQTAEGGMSTISDMLQRMRELAVQSVNSTNTSSDINSLNQEYTQLSQEVDRTLTSVQFNGQNVLSAGGDFTFQVGANSGQVITVPSAVLNLFTGSLTGILPSQSAAGASSYQLTVSANSANAAALCDIDNALQAITDARAQIGAAQSRFQNTISFLQIASEDQTAAKGRIMDANFASETANLSRAQILQQAGTAMIAQANQLPQGVLSLLRG